MRKRSGSGGNVGSGGRHRGNVMKCDQLRASRIYDSLRHRLKADPAKHEDFIRAMGEGVEIYEFESSYGMKFRFLNRDGIWAVGFDLDEFLANDRNREIFEAVKGMNEQCWRYLFAHMVSGFPGPWPEPAESVEDR